MFLNKAERKLLKESINRIGFTYGRIYGQSNKSKISYNACLSLLSKGLIEGESKTIFQKANPNAKGLAAKFGVSYQTFVGEIKNIDNLKMSLDHEV